MEKGYHKVVCPPPKKKESSFSVRLELKIKGVNHGQEIAFSRANHQQAARSCNPSESVSYRRRSLPEDRGHRTDLLSMAQRVRRYAY